MEIQERSLCSFEQYPRPVVVRLVEELRGVFRCVSFGVGGPPKYGGVVPPPPNFVDKRFTAALTRSSNALVTTTEPGAVRVNSQVESTAVVDCESSTYIHPRSFGHHCHFPFKDLRVEKRTRPEDQLRRRIDPSNRKLLHLIGLPPVVNGVSSIGRSCSNRDIDALS